MLEALKERGDVVSKTAYGDWTRAGDYSRSLTQHATKLVQRNLTPGGDKNGADINLALDALEMAFTHPHINAYVIVGGDSDFISLVEKLKQYDKQIFVVGGRSFTSQVMQRNCHEFIAYENLIGGARRGDRGGRGPSGPVRIAGVDRAGRAAGAPRAQGADRPRGHRRSSACSRARCCSSTRRSRSGPTAPAAFRDFAEKLAAAGVVTLKESGRNILVELKEDGHSSATRGSRDAAGRERAASSASARQRSSRRPTSRRRPAHGHQRRRGGSRGRPKRSPKCGGSSRPRSSRRAGRCTCAR